MRRIACLVLACCALAALGIVSPASGATSPPASGPPYVDPNVNRYVLLANNQWDIGETSQRASQFVGSPAATNPGANVPGGDVPRYVWASTCPATKQTVTFRRKVWLPGPTQSLSFAASPTYPRSGSYVWSDPLNWVKLVVNGTVVAKLTGSSQYTSVSAPALLNAVKYGYNDYEVVVQKAPDPSYLSTCGGTTAKRLGVQFAIIGSQFLADVGVNQPSANVWRHVVPGQHNNYTVNLTVYNHGPAATRTGTFQVTVQPGFMSLSGTPYVSDPAPFAACTNPTPYSVQCPLRAWFAPGSTSQVTVRFGLDAPTDEGDDAATQVHLNWQLLPTSQPDPTYQNNTAALTEFECYPKATQYDCNTH